MAALRTGPLTSMIMLGVLLLTSQSFAAESDSSATDAQFTKFDSNKDGKVSADEHAAGAQKMFRTMDGNMDGRVTAAEMDAAHQQVTGKETTKSDMTAADKIKVVDTDGDGILTAEEHSTGSHAMFEKMDSDKGGFLSKDELAAGHASMMKKPSP